MPFGFGQAPVRIGGQPAWIRRTPAGQLKCMKRDHILGACNADHHRMGLAVEPEQPIALRVDGVTARQRRFAETRQGRCIPEPPLRIGSRIVPREAVGRKIVSRIGTGWRLYGCRLAAWKAERQNYCGTAHSCPLQESRRR